MEQMTHLAVQTTPKLTSFAAKLRKLVDKRDNRGKRHKLAFVLGGVVLAIMSGRSAVSSIQRYISNRLRWLRRVLGDPSATAVSRAQLPRILATVDWSALNELLTKQFGLRLEPQGRLWGAVDGKTLRGVAGQSERVVLAVSHSNRQTVAQQPLPGTKRSEITAVRELLTTTRLEQGSLTLDALHFNPGTTAQINQAGGHYLSQVKNNQPRLLAQLSQEAASAQPVSTLKTVEKGHGRLEIRQAAFFKVSHLPLDDRWADSGLATLIVVARRTTESATQKRSAEVSCYGSNVPLEAADETIPLELLTAIRQHWGVETHNHIRDVIFQEDHVKTKSGNQAQVLASLRSVAIELFQMAGFDNFQAALETFTDCPDQFEAFLAQYDFL